MGRTNPRGLEDLRCMGLGVRVLSSLFGYRDRQTYRSITFYLVFSLCDMICSEDDFWNSSQ
jgi:hypothetical protein